MHKWNVFHLLYILNILFCKTQAVADSTCLSVALMKRAESPYSKAWAFWSNRPHYRLILFECRSRPLHIRYFYLPFRYLTYVAKFSAAFLQNRVDWKELHLPSEEPHDDLLQVMFTMWAFSTHSFVSMPGSNFILSPAFSGVLHMFCLRRFALMVIEFYFASRRRISVVGMSVSEIFPGMLDMLSILLFNGFRFKNLF